MSNNLPKVSVITLTYRHFEHLKQTISSVLSQDYKNIEYIISDDGSESFPVLEIENYIQKCNSSNISVQIIHREKNVGTVRNLNLSCKKTTGDYLINLSCGDVFFDNSVITKIVNRFLQTDSKVVVTTRLAYDSDFIPRYLLPHYEERRLISSFKHSIEQYKAFILNMYYDMASGSAMYFTRDILERYDYFDEKYLLWEDGPFLAKFLWENKLELAYDIISIWYETGGVSSGGYKGASDGLKKDIMLFAQTDQRIHRDCLSLFEKRMLDFNYLRMCANCRVDTISVLVRYFPQALVYYKYRTKRKRARLKDEDHIASILQNDSNCTEQ